MWRVVDIAQDHRTLLLSRNNLRICSGDEELGRIPLTDIQCVMVHGHGAMISLTLAEALAKDGIPLILCGSNHVPVSLTLPVSNNYEQAGRLLAQSSISLPRQKQLWRQIVQSKISAQARALEIAGKSQHDALRKLSGIVRSGDPENVEARAARFYWPRLMGTEFRRDIDAQGLNAHLNYGYAIVRGAMSRAVVGAGLSPGLGLHHRSRLNPFQLVDDLMEPFRPIVDISVWKNRSEWNGAVTDSAKRELADLINGLLRFDDGVTTVVRAMHGVSLSLAEVYSGQRKGFRWPVDWGLQRQSEFELDN